MADKLRSTHIFILPFKILDEENKITKGERRNRVLTNNDQWEVYNPVEKSDIKENKNLLKYFNKYAKDSMFKYGDDNNDAYVMELHNKKIKDCKFSIYFKDEKNKIEETYNLKLKEVIVKFFDTSIGTLSFVIDNYEYSGIEDVLLINNQGRKIYEAYVGEPCSIIKISGEGFEEISQDISKTELTYSKENEILQNNDIIGSFLKLDKIEPVLDDRMFTISHYLEDIDLYKDDKQKTDYWYNYTFIDTANNKCCQNRDMENKLLEESTYLRWENYGTFYGATRYSFVLWSKVNWKDDEPFSLEVLNTHIKTLYFQMLSLIIAQRSTIVMLNEHINNILEKEDTKETEYNEYLNYLSKLSFREITNQEQGIELYALCRKQMQIEELTEELDVKIKTLNDKAERKRDKEQQETIEFYGQIFTVIGIILGVLGISECYLETTAGVKNIFGVLVTVLRDFSLITVIVLVGIIFYLKNKK